MNISSVYADVSEPNNPMSLLDILEEVEKEYFQPNRSDAFNDAIKRIDDVGKRIEKTKTVIRADEIKAQNQLNFIDQHIAKDREKLHSLTVELEAERRRYRDAAEEEKEVRTSCIGAFRDRVNNQQALVQQRIQLTRQCKERIAPEIKKDQLEIVVRQSNVFLFQDKENNVQAFNPASRETFSIGSANTVEEISRALNEINENNQQPSDDPMDTNNSNSSSPSQVDMDSEDFSDDDIIS